MRIILTVYGTKEYSGLPKYFYFLAKHLALNGLDVEVIVDSVDRLERVHEITQDKNLLQVSVIGPEYTGMVSKAKYSYKIDKYLKDKDFDILHSCDVLPYFYLGRKNRKPVVFQPFSNELFQMGSRDIRRFLFFVLRKCGQEADALAVVGEWQVEQMLRDYKVARRKTFILPVGIDIDFIRGIAGQREGIRKQMGISENTFVVLSVNILHPFKGINYLIEAFQGMPDAVLYIVSSGPEEGNLKKLVSALRLQDRVVFTGNVEEKALYDYYAMADVYAHPTLLNGSSMGIMEAEVFGLPIVSTHQEFLVEGNGFVVPEKNPKALAGAILEVRRGNRVKMGKRSMEIVKQYDFKEIAKTAIGKYEELIGGSNGRKN